MFYNNFLLVLYCYSTSQFSTEMYRPYLYIVLLCIVVDNVLMEVYQTKNYQKINILFVTHL
jgi:hypothetical protein